MCAFPAAQSHVSAEHDLSSHEESESSAKSMMHVAKVYIAVGKRDLSGIRNKRIPTGPLILRSNSSCTKNELGPRNR